MLCNVNLFSSACAIFMKLLLTHNFVNKILFTTASTLCGFISQQPYFCIFFFLLCGSSSIHPSSLQPPINFPIQEMFILPQLRSRHATLILAYRVPRCPLGVFCLVTVIRTYWMPSVGFSSFIFGSYRHLLVFEICWYWSSL